MFVCSDYDVADEEELQRLVEEEFLLRLKEEELLAIGWCSLQTARVTALCIHTFHSPLV